MVAAMQGKVGCVQLLLQEMGADPDVATASKRETALHLAAFSGHYEVLSLSLSLSLCFSVSPFFLPLLPFLLPPCLPASLCLPLSFSACVSDSDSDSLWPSLAADGQEPAHKPEDYERRRRMESHVTSFLKHPQVYASLLAHFLEERCGVELWPAAAPTSDRVVPEQDRRQSEAQRDTTTQRHQTLRSDLDWWEGGKVSGRVRVNDTGTSFPRPASSAPVWPRPTQGAGHCTVTSEAVAPGWRLCRL